MGNSCPLDAITYNRVIASLSKSYKMDKALNLLNVMISKGLYPDTTTYQSLAFGLSREDGMDRAIGMFRRVQDKGLSPDTNAFFSKHLTRCFIILLGFCKSWRTDLAIYLFAYMVPMVACLMNQPISFSSKALLMRAFRMRRKNCWKVCAVGVL
jgi:pentatricopeptide repeat protein